MSTRAENFLFRYTPPFRYRRIGDYTGCYSNRIEDDEGYVILELPSDLTPDSQQHDDAESICLVLTQARAALAKVTP